MFGRSGQRRVHTRIHFAQPWHQPVAHEVAAKLCIGVRAVGHIRLLQLSQKRQDLRFAHLQERSPHPVGSHRAHRREPAQARPAQQAQEKRFGLILEMMRHTHRSAQLGKPRIAQATSGHFETFARACRLLSRVESAHLQGNFVQTAKFAHKRLIPLALRAAQTEIDV